MKSKQHFTTINVSGFRGLRDLYLEEIGQFNLILGANDVGKTSVLEAVFLVAGLSSPQLFVRMQNLRGHLVSDFNDLALLFHGLNASGTIETAATTGADHRRLNVTAAYVDGDVVEAQQVAETTNGNQGDYAAAVRSSLPYRPRVLRCDGEIIELASGNTEIFCGEVAASDGKVTTSTEPGSTLASGERAIPVRYVHAGYSYDSTAIASVVVSKKADVVLECLRMVNPNVCGIATHDSTVYVDAGHDRMMPLSMFGSGLVRAVYMATACILDNESVLMIDEIENGLHGSSIRPVLHFLFEHCAAQKTQLFVTTQRKDVLRSIGRLLDQDEHADHRAKTAVYVLTKDEDQQVRADRRDHGEIARRIKEPR